MNHHKPEIPDEMCPCFHKNHLKVVQTPERLHLKQKQEEAINDF
jgi:hypothetical protein